MQNAEELIDAKKGDAWTWTRSDGGGVEHNIIIQMIKFQMHFIINMRTTLDALMLLMSCA